MDYAHSTGQGRPSRTTTRLWAGSTFALISAITFAFNVACGPLVYEAGGNIHAVNFIRPVVVLAVALFYIVDWHQSSKPVSHDTRHLLQGQEQQQNRWHPKPPRQAK